jgi:uncharacterized membrane protein YidH (DUF202 family)
VKVYNIHISSYLAQSLLIGILPIGGIFGALSFKVVLKYLRRKTSFYFMAIWMLVSIGFVQITTFETVLIGRFM